MIRQRIVNQIWQISTSIQLNQNLSQEIRLSRCVCFKKSFHNNSKLHSSQRPNTIKLSKGKSGRTSEIENVDPLSAISAFEARRKTQEGIHQSILSELRERNISVDGRANLQNFVMALIVDDSEMVKESLKKLLADLQSRRTGKSIDFILNQLDVKGKSLWPSVTEDDLWYIWEILQAFKSSPIRIMKQIHHNLLNECIFRGNMKLAECITTDLQENGRILTPFERTTILRLRLENNTFQDYWEALEEYRYFRDQPLRKGDLQPFKASSHASLLYHLTNVEVIDPYARFLPIEIALELLTDMREDAESIQGVETVKVQTYLLDHYGKKAVGIRDPEQLLQLRQIVLNIHQAIIEEKGEELGNNIVLLTSLMNAYNKVSLPNSAMDTWNKIIALDIDINPITVAVIFDTCGFAGRLTDARRIFAWIEAGERFSYLMEKNSWDAWLECLARCGALREACYIALHVMGPNLQEREKLLDTPNFRQTKGYLTEARRSRVEKEEAEERERLLPFSSSSSSSSSINSILADQQTSFSNSRPDVKTFRLLLNLAKSSQIRKNDQSDSEIIPDLLRQIQVYHPEVMPLLKNELISQNSSWSTIFPQ